MSATIDFKAQPFSGIGDPRTVEYRRFIENQIQKHQFVPYSERGYALPNIAADLQLMEGFKAQERGAHAYSRSPAATERRALEATIAARGDAATAAEQLQLEVLAPLAHQIQLSAEDRDLLKSLRDDRDYNVELVERCSKATEAVFDVCNTTCSGEFMTEWNKIKKEAVPRYTMVERFVRRLNTGRYLQRHRDFVTAQKQRLIKFMPGATTACVEPSIYSIADLESFMTLEAEVQTEIAQHAVEVEKERDANGEPLMRAVAADTDAVRVSMMYDSMDKKSVVLLGALNMVQAVELNPALKTYAELVGELRIWCNNNRPSVAAMSAARGGSSSMAAAAASTAMAAEERFAAMTAQAVVSGLQQFQYQQQQQQQQQQQRGGGFGGGNYGDEWSPEQRQAWRKTMPCMHWTGEKGSCTRQDCEFIHVPGVNQRAQHQQQRRDRSRSRSPSQGRDSKRQKPATPVQSRAGRYVSSSSSDF